MGARVYQVTLTKTFDANILAESEEALLEALNDENFDNGNWDLPDWEYDYSDLIRPKPPSLPEFDVAVIREKGKLAIVSARGEGVEDLRQQAENELTRLHQEQKQLSLFPPEKHP